MAKVEYRECDICRKRIEKCSYSEEAKRIYLSRLNHMDICNTCIKKLATISQDYKFEKLMSAIALSNMPKYYEQKENEELFDAYCKGVEAAIYQLFHHKVRRYKL